MGYYTIVSVYLPARGELHSPDGKGKKKGAARGRKIFHAARAVRFS
jgi:hypothetical protein